MFDLLVHKVTYELRETRVKAALIDAAGALLPSIQASLCGNELEPMTNPQLLARSLYEEPAMPVDSEIERHTTQESHATQITVFAKLPHTRIQTPVGEYNPDFGYVLKNGNDAEAMYLVVETKGYANLGDVPGKERWKIDSAKRFFEALQKEGLPVQFETKLNGLGLTQILQSLTAKSGAT